MSRKKEFFLSFALFLFCANFCFSSYLTKEETNVGKYLREISITEKESGMESIDCIYVINLDKRPEKLAQIQKQFTKAGLKFNRVRGVEGWLLTEADKKTLVGPYPIKLKPGEYGCTLSHISIYKDAIDRGFSRIWILEDDAKILRDVQEIPKLLKKLSKIDPEWDIFYTDLDWRVLNNEYHRPKTGFKLRARPGQHLKKTSYYTKRKKISKNIQQVRSRWGTHSYIVSRKGLTKLKNYFFHTYFWASIDWDIHFIPKIRQYSSRNDIVTNPRDRAASDTLPDYQTPTNG